MNRNLLLIPLAALVLAAILSSVFVVDERHKALVLRFGDHQPAISQKMIEPGIERAKLGRRIATTDDRSS